MRGRAWPWFVYNHLTRGFMTYKVVTLLHNALAFPRLRPAVTPPGARVSLLVPARDEAHNLARTLPGLLAQGAEVIVLDDHSSDDTAAVAARLGARVLRGAPLPPGWTGKAWACQQLAGAATGELLVFTDADVFWHPGALGGLLREQAASGADLLSVWPRQDNRTLGERLITPLVEVTLLVGLPFAFLRLPSPRAGAANGQVMAFRRAPYEALGGHAAVRGELLEDVQFAYRLRAAGGRQSLALGQRCVGVRMYRSYPASVRGLGKSLLAVHGGHRARLPLTLGLQFALYTLPWLLRVPGWRWLRLASVLERPLVNLISGRRRGADLAEGLLGPLMPLLMLPAYVRALRRRAVWKGRAYRQ
ncbi:glycosyltransferase [Deinococcus petrolearius]|uniref:Glycosyltransferase n=1 Tax=Deinococcus petrolearius TaxID=1751295 RepID=A0ABW1DKS3_9DEIO